MDITPLQQHYLDLANLALITGALIGSLIVFLLAVIAVRGFSSWK